MVALRNSVQVPSSRNLEPIAMDSKQGGVVVEVDKVFRYALLFEALNRP